MKTMNCKWTGVRPLLMNNGQMCDPLNEVVKKTKEITKKGSKKTTDSDYETLYRLKWFGELYHSPDIGLFIPSDNVERCIQQGAQKQRLGKDVLAAVFCSESEIKLHFAGTTTAEKLYESGKFILKKPVVMANGSRVISVRPMIPTGWHINFTLEYDDSIINEKDLLKSMVDAGALVGLGDWRPKFGRFGVEIV